MTLRLVWIMYLWITLCRRTRQVVSFFIGGRSEESGWRLWQWIPRAYRHCHTFSDFLETYRPISRFLVC